MSRNTSSTTRAATQGPRSVNEALGDFTEQATHIGDAATRRVLADLRALAMGLAQLFLAKDNPQDQAAAALLAQANVTASDATVLANQGKALIALAQDLEAADAAYQAALAKLEAGRAKAHDVSVSFANLARAKLGAQSPFLERLGVKIVGGRKGMKRAPRAKANPAGTPSTPPKA